MLLSYILREQVKPYKYIKQVEYWIKNYKRLCKPTIKSFWFPETSKDIYISQLYFPPLLSLLIHPSVTPIQESSLCLCKAGHWQYFILESFQHKIRTEIRFNRRSKYIFFQAEEMFY